METWGKGRDGINDWMIFHRASEALDTIGQYVIVNQEALPTDTWAGAAPFDEIMRKLGGRVMVSGGLEDRDTYFAMNLRCETPNAENIIEEVRQWQQGGSNMLILPGLYPTRGD